MKCVYICSHLPNDLNSLDTITSGVIIVIITKCEGLTFNVLCGVP